PFALAFVIAYVLTPAVDWVESRRVPRAASILIVYVVVLGSLGLFIRLTAPRVVQELSGLRRELPALTHTVRTQWVAWVQSRLHEGGANPATPPPPPPPEGENDAHEGAATLVARPQADGSLVIELEKPLAIHAGRRGGYVVESVREVRPEAFDVD